MRILLKTQLDSHTRLGKDGLGIVKALLERDHDVDILPTQVTPPISRETAQALVFPILDSGYDLELEHGPYYSSRAANNDLFYQREGRAKRNVWWVTESSRGNTDPPLLDTFVDTFVMYSKSHRAEFELNHLREMQSVPEMSVLQGGFDPSPWEFLEDAAEEVQNSFPDRSREKDTFRFAAVYKGTDEGDLARSIRLVSAFESLKIDKGSAFDAELILLSQREVDTFDKFPNVRVLSSVMDNNQLKQFYWSVDCIVSVSSISVKNLTALEATACGTPVLLSDIEGHQWLHPSIQKPIQKITHYKQHQDTFIKEGMWDMYQNRYEANHRTARHLATYVKKTMTWDAKIQKLGEMLNLPL